VRIKRLTN